MALFADLGNFKFETVTHKPVEGEAFPKFKPFGGDVFGELANVDLPTGLLFKFPDAFDTQEANLAVPRATVCIAFNTVHGEGDRSDWLFGRSLLC